uniref:TLDc domain-containing protein n=1 Tax=Rhizophagus irregularis (strain DAOM 181602 / DAOM 197198 / MUCL 43194) TaxID=747089 RepID=U9U084_RHIID
MVTKFLEVMNGNPTVMNNNNILSHVVDEKNAVYNSYYVGPSFGNCDLYLYHSIEGGLGFSCKKSSYEKQIRETEELCFVEEFEVFQIMLNLPISL